jgi:NAD(P)-dependent dehydrogenase (short-subunit alcohol dehydrogenase family)
MSARRQRVCLLTGASGRLGTAFCRRFADRYQIIAVTHYRSLPAPTQHQRLVDPLAAASTASGNGAVVHLIQADLTQDADLRRVVDVAAARFGRIDLLVNAAVVRPRGSLLSLQDGDLQPEYLLNTVVPIRLAALVADQCWLGQPDENRRFNRNVVNLSSTYGTNIPSGSGPLVGYGASKAALNLMSCALSAELRAHGIRVNVLAPSTFPGELSSEEVAEQVVALDRGRCSGRIVLVDRRGVEIVRRGWSMPAERPDRVGRPAAAAPSAPAEEPAQQSERPERPAGQMPRPLATLPRPLPDLRRHFVAHGYVRVPAVLNPERLLPCLRQEAQEQEQQAVTSEWDRYGLGPDGSYFSGPMRFTSAGPGRWLRWLHRHPAMVRFARTLTANQQLVPDVSLSYMYYSDGCFIHAHTDVPECQLTLLTSVVGQVPPLVVYPRLRNQPPEELVSMADEVGGVPPGGQLVQIPTAGFLAISGRELPHRRPEVRLDNGTRVVLATLCYSEPDAAGPTEEAGA